MKECNICANYQCSLIKSGQDRMRTRHPVQVEAMKSSCKKYTKLSNYTATVFEMLIRKQAGTVLQLLKNMDMYFVETKYAPFFNFTKKEAAK